MYRLMYRLNGGLKDLGIAHKIGETIAMASFVINGLLSFLNQRAAL